jgi:hypothetical protein
MPHGRPDWYNIAPLIQIHASEDVNELAARLNPVNVYDRRGNVVMIDSFAEGIAKGSYDVYGAASLSWSIEASRTEGMCLKVNDLSNDADGFRIRYTQGLQYASTMAIEASWCTSLSRPLVELSMGYYALAGIYLPKIRYNHYTNAIDYWGTDSNWHNIATVPALNAGTGTWHFIKMVVDWENGEYLRVLINHENYSLAGIPIYFIATPSNHYVYSEFYCEGYGAVATDLYIDSIIITINEG